MRTIAYKQSLLLVLAILPPALALINFKTKIIFAYQARSLSLAKWLDILTLCLAPLGTHIAFGLPTPVILSEDENYRWSDRLPFFNPISIIWRYCAITDRRIRAKKWDHRDMAICNAVLWDQGGWRGDETMTSLLRSRITTRSKRPYVDLVSGSSLATIVMVAQGIQGIVYIMHVFVNGGQRRHVGLPGLFLPLSILSLFRLLAAPWLSDDYACVPESKRQARDGVGRCEGGEEEGRFARVWSFRGILFRLWYMVLGFGWFVFTSAGLIRGTIYVYQYEIDPLGYAHLSAFQLLSKIMYFSLGFGFFSIFFFYAVKEQSSSTIVPCIQQRWYKVYTIVLAILALACVVLGAMESRMMTCEAMSGEYTTLPPDSNGC